MNHCGFRTLAILAVGACLGAGFQALFFSAAPSAIAETGKPTPDVKAIAAELEAIKGKLPDQSHAMEDVSHHFANLWFAVQDKNWPLATFYLDETRSHLRWAVRISTLR